MGWVCMLISLMGLYLLRFIVTFNQFFLLFFMTVVFTMFFLSGVFIINSNNALIEKYSIIFGEDADHVRNYS